MRAIILAGGKGSRLLPYTTVIPKPLMPVGDRPILEIIIRQLKYYGFSRVTMAVGYLAELIEAYFSDGNKYGIKIDYSREDKPLGTIGALSLIDGLDRTFLVMNGDVLTNLNYCKLVEFHEMNNAVATIATYNKEIKIDLGVLEMDEGFRLKQYTEKPTLKYKVSMGIYVFEPEILSFIDPNGYLDFPDLVVDLIKAGRKVIAFPFDGYWLDIGRHEDHLRAQEEFETLEEFRTLKEELDLD
ncbi:MAG: nucleoside-diphosphate-sugar pyrophosphorylase [Desulfobulbaceae bacterium C00003063]|nr:MAG: nucleoside-diphosphate-sugar pyrophosphorylase [Desulfobulbaceae bacterium C00003063]OEU81946.1 MAG: nucleoside-diphosphate-sugar pyrophosphorylase [Desulfobacterales bacterium S5133MH4]